MSDSNSKPSAPAGRRAPRKEKFTTLSGLPLETLYTAETLASQNPEKSIGYPGEFPYTRGIYPTMYRGRFWTMRQYASFASAAESNESYRYLLGKGQIVLSVAFDLPTPIGMDSDHPMAQGEVGKGGVAIDSIEDMEMLFDRIPLEKVSTSMTINSTAAILLCLYVAVAKKQGANLAKLSGTVQNDILKEYIARGTYIYPVRPAMRIVTDVFAWCRTELPKWNTSPSPAITSARRARPRFRKSPSRWPMPSRTFKPPSTLDSASTNSRRSSPFSSTRTAICLRRSPSTAPPAAYGRELCASVSTLATRARCFYASTHKPPGHL